MAFNDRKCALAQMADPSAETRRIDTTELVGVSMGLILHACIQCRVRFETRKQLPEKAQISVANIQRCPSPDAQTFADQIEAKFPKIEQ
jgi:hypothetical protein